MSVARKISLLLIVTLCAAGRVAPAQSVATETYAIRGARVVTISGPEIADGVVLIRGGKIEAVGPTGAVTLPPDARLIEARGLQVYPGMIDAGTALGLTEISSVSATVDLSEVGEMNPNAQALYGLNPYSSHVRVARVAGVTSVATLPAGGILSGQAALINLDGATPREMALVPAAALVFNFPSTAPPTNIFGLSPSQPVNLNEQLAARDRRLEGLRKLLRDAEAYGRAVEASRRPPGAVPRPAESLLLAALVPYVRGERPVLMRANRAAEIRAALRFAAEMRLRAVIIGGNDAWQAAEALRAQNVPVILTGVLDLPSREDDYYDTLYENAAKLQRAGVRFCISTGDTGAHVRDLPFHAGMAAAFGLPREEALKSVTLYPAEIFGVADRLGTIEKGKIANLVVTDGDLLEARTKVRHLFINGREIPLTSRHTELYEQFRARP